MSCNVVQNRRVAVCVNLCVLQCWHALSLLSSIGTLVAFLLLGLILRTVFGAWACHLFYNRGLPFVPEPLDISVPAEDRWVQSGAAFGATCMSEPESWDLSLEIGRLSLRIRGLRVSSSSALVQQEPPCPTASNSSFLVVPAASDPDLPLTRVHPIQAALVDLAVGFGPRSTSTELSAAPVEYSFISSAFSRGYSDCGNACRTSGSIHYDHYERK